MATCLPQIWTLDSSTRDKILRELDAVALAACAENTSLRVGDSGAPNTSACASCKSEYNRALLITVCSDTRDRYTCFACLERQELVWRRAAAQLERALEQRGWGHA